MNQSRGLTALEFVTITLSSTDVVAETIASSFVGSFLTQLVQVVKKFAKLELMLTSDFVFVILNFQGM
jgi:hypothetical protein